MGKAKADQEIDTKTENTWHRRMASACAFLKRKGWYTVLLIVSSIYVYYYRYEIYSLDPLTAQSLVFILWLLLLFWPLISEMEFLGVKVKKEVEKSTKEVKETTKEVKDSVDKIQAEIFQLQLSNSIANSVNIVNAPLPSEQQMKGMEKSASISNEKNTDVADALPEVDPDIIYLFEVRMSIEMELKSICQKLQYVEQKQPSITRMVRFLANREFIDFAAADLITQVVNIANRGVHGEIVDKKYIDFVKKCYPKVIGDLKALNARL